MIALISVLPAKQARACTLPYGGWQYDRQVSVEPIEGEENAFTVSVPLEMKDMPLQESNLAWKPRPFHPNRQVAYSKIELEKDGDGYVGRFTAPAASDAYEVSVVIWYSFANGGCPVIARFDLDGLVE